MSGPNQPSDLDELGPPFRNGTEPAVFDQEQAPIFSQIKRFEVSFGYLALKSTDISDLKSKSGGCGLMEILEGL